jgi:hypothetical protein
MDREKCLKETWFVPQNLCVEEGIGVQKEIMAIISYDMFCDK